MTALACATWEARRPALSFEDVVDVQTTICVPEVFEAQNALGSR
jgi:hypothetical protein